MYDWSQYKPVIENLDRYHVPPKVIHKVLQHANFGAKLRRLRTKIHEFSRRRGTSADLPITRGFNPPGAGRFRAFPTPGRPLPTAKSSKPAVRRARPKDSAAERHEATSVHTTEKGEDHAPLRARNQDLDAAGPLRNEGSIVEGPSNLEESVRNAGGWYNEDPYLDNNARWRERIGGLAENYRNIEAVDRVGLPELFAQDLETSRSRSQVAPTDAETLQSLHLSRQTQISEATEVGSHVGSDVTRSTQLSPGYVPLAATISQTTTSPPLSTIASFPSLARSFSGAYSYNGSFDAADCSPIALRQMHRDYCCHYAWHDNFSNMRECSTCWLREIHFIAAFPHEHFLGSLDVLESLVRGDDHSQYLDRYQNSPTHYLARSGMASFDMLLFFDKRFGSLHQRNVFGETPFHVLDPSSMSHADMRNLLRKGGGGIYSHQFLLQSRDNQGRTILSSIADRISCIYKLKVLLKVGYLTKKHKSDRTLRELFNSRDCQGRTLIDKIHDHLQAWRSTRAMSQQYEADEVFDNTMRDIGEIVMSELAIQNSPQIFDKSINIFVSRFIHNFDARAHEDLFIIDDHGRNLLHAIPHLPLDALGQQEKFEWALKRRLFNDTLEAWVGLDVNQPDKYGYGPLHSLVLAAGWWRTFPLVFNELWREPDQIGMTQSCSLGQLLSRIQSVPRLTNVVAFIAYYAPQWGFGPSAPIGELLEKAHDEYTSRQVHDTGSLFELLRVHEDQELSAEMPRSHSTDDVSSIRKRNNKQKHRSLPLSLARAYNIVELFYGSGADVNMRDRFGRVSLHYACSHGLLDYVQVLLSFGANVHARDTDGQGIIAYSITTMNLVQDPTVRASICACIEHVRNVGGVDVPSDGQEYFCY